MSTGPARMRGSVIVASPHALMAHAFSALLSAANFDVLCQPTSADAVLRAVDDGVVARRALLLVDPDQDAWDVAIDGVRSRDTRLGVVVLVARSAYWVQRRWRQRTSDGRLFADCLLSVDARPADLVRAVEEAIERPGRESGFWLSDQSKHRDASFAWPGGSVAKTIRDYPLKHAALVLEARGARRAQVAKRLGYELDSLSAVWREARRGVGLESDVALGHWATRMGLLDDVPVQLPHWQDMDSG